MSQCASSSKFKQTDKLEGGGQKLTKIEMVDGEFITKVIENAEEYRGRKFLTTPNISFANL